MGPSVVWQEREDPFRRPQPRDKAVSPCCQIQEAMLEGR